MYPLWFFLVPIYALVGFVSGAIAGALRSFLFVFLGAGMGFVLGIASYVALMVPFGLAEAVCLTPEQKVKTPRFWIGVLLVVLLAALVLAGIAPWYAIALC
jgi:hypothetical protein